MIVSKPLRRAALSCAFLVTTALTAGAAQATKTYDFNGTFAGVGKVEGSFAVDFSAGAYTLKGLTFALNGTDFTTANSSTRVVGSTLFVGGNNLQADGLSAFASSPDFSIGFGFNSQTGALTSFSSFRIVSSSTRGIIRGSSLGFAAAAVPEPASWALMLGGFGMVGAAMRGRRKSLVSFG